VSHDGRFYDLTNVTIEPKPLTRPSLPIWIGGRTEHAWRRVGALGDGWLASGVTPLDVFQGRGAIRAHLEASGRSIEDDHYGVILTTYLAGSTEEALDRVATSGLRLRPDVPLESYAALGRARDILERIQEYLAAGASKFVLRLACREEEALDQLQRLAESVAVPVNTGSSAFNR
jgi:alkanesulfonate monooxygenase SsuD/methylene tetrahydromethanopterin reductase-like flavin-dependent oxidoreductase (luciferase family)